MGWKSRLKKTGRGLKKAGKFTAKHAPDVIEVAAPPVLDKLFEKHGDKVDSIVTRVDNIAEAVEGVADVIPRLDSIDRRVGHLRDTQVTRGTGERIEKKVDEAIRQVHEVRRGLEAKVDGITAQIAELRHLIKLKAHEGDSDG